VNDDSSSAAEEVRLAMAWNGGVSLAIWMGGVAVELDTARRAHLGPQEDDGQVRAVYHALAHAFQREIVIDILTGASAGGINGALLGAVITKQRVLRPKFLRDRWQELGDLPTLLQPINESRPASLMKGEYFRDKVEKVFRAVTGDESADEDWLTQTKPSDGRIGPGEVLLDIQTTNVLGTQRGFSDEWGQTLWAREHRSPVRFRAPEDFTSGALAAAARASASFPAAFEPAPLMGQTAGLAGFPSLKRWAIDGGLLENAPIRPAIDLIPTRRVERPAKRFVCYVNAAPAQAKKDVDDPPQPSLRAVLGHVVNLPRDGRFIDQLIAIEDAKQRPTGVREAATGLLCLPAPHLKATAEALFDAYRKPRMVASIRELFSSATDGGLLAAMVDLTVDRLGAGQLPWIPQSLTPPRNATEWRWGLRPAQRILLLQLEVLRLAAHDEDRVERAKRMKELQEFRLPLNKALARLEDARMRFASSRAIAATALRLAQSAREEGQMFDEELNELDSLMVGFRCEAFDAVHQGTKTLHAALKSWGDDLPPGITMAGLFGEPEGEFGEAQFQTFLARALAIEVVRRAFSPDHELEPAQNLHFVQFTPYAPVRVFERAPLGSLGPHTSEEKLTGLELAHFSAFYRASWRVNDFMWGRLDAATRIVDLLVSPTRAGVVELNGSSDRLRQLAEVLVPAGDDAKARDLRLLANEAFADAQLPIPDILDDVRAEASEATENVDDVAGLQEHMTKALAADLADADRGGYFTRIVCARAAQYEILQQEIEPLAKATAEDARLGCLTKSFSYDANRGVLEQARDLVDGQTLPRRLGCGDPDETTSTLAVRTVSHAALVTLSSLKSVGIPFGRSFAVFRSPFLSLAGITAQKFRYRAAALVAFVAGSFFITARVTKAQPGTVELDTALSMSTLATLVAISAVLPLVVLPLWRALQAQKTKRRIQQGVWGSAMFLVSGLAALVVASFAVGFGNALTSWKGFQLSAGLAAAVTLVPLGAGWIARYVPLPVVGDRVVRRLSTRVGFTALVITGVAGLLIYKSLGELRDMVAIRDVLFWWLDSENWRAFFGVFGSASEFWRALEDNWREIAVIGSYASVVLAGVYGLQGARRAVVAKVRG
jgi:patatin-related protein